MVFFWKTGGQQGLVQLEGAMGKALARARQILFRAFGIGQLLTEVGDPLVINDRTWEMVCKGVVFGDGKNIDLIFTLEILDQGSLVVQGGLYFCYIDKVGLMFELVVFGVIGL